ncbi:hypothetical protein [Micromonospora sp. NPDC049301]|uniref:hypothetical protein n=1 Tax=Micromonospora sp. NPDC049301 TaxID=3155723 RepID=UPI003428AC30
MGITQPFLDRLRPSVGAAAHRHDPTANPLTYEERKELVTRALVGAGLEKSAFAVCPFPIEQPELLTDLIPLSVTAFTTVCDEWNVRKIGVLRQLGYDVQVLLWRGTQRITGSAVRRMIGQGNPEWTSFVPAACRDYLLDLDIAARLSAMTGRKDENDARLP